MVGGGPEKTGGGSVATVGVGKKKMVVAGGKRYDDRWMMADLLLPIPPVLSRLYIQCLIHSSHGVDPDQSSRNFRSKHHFALKSGMGGPQRSYLVP